MATLDRLHCFQPYCFSSLADPEARREEGAKLERTWECAINLYRNEFIGPPEVEPVHEPRSPLPQLPVALLCEDGALIVESDKWLGCSPRMMWALMSAWAIEGGDPFQTKCRHEKSEVEGGGFHDDPWDVHLHIGWDWLYRESREWGWDYLKKQFTEAVQFALRAHREPISFYMNKARAEADALAKADQVDGGLPGPTEETKKCADAIRKVLSRKQELLYSQIHLHLRTWDELTAREQSSVLDELVISGDCKLEKTVRGQLLKSLRYEAEA